MLAIVDMIRKENQMYIDMGIMTPEIVEELEFGDTLKKIQEKTRTELPAVGEEK